jgi:hypothetical protein
MTNRGKKKGQTEALKFKITHSIDRNDHFYVIRNDYTDVRLIKTPKGILGISLLTINEEFEARHYIKNRRKEIEDSFIEFRTSL